MSYFANFTVVGRCSHHQTVSCLCKLAGCDPSPAEGNSRAPVDWGRARLCSKAVFFPSLVTANPRGSNCSGLGSGSLPALERQGDAWCLPVLAGPAGEEKGRDEVAWLCTWEIWRHRKHCMSRSFRLLCT